ncbi:uncharacterized protein LOC125016591 isoform X2 [Mugil cephalus]|uniref:uncharacterized protein LOC125016591 isoform X2 n=1 Tax=Mugil cephalus TaxID=48193 RepID=UPI001FB7D36B|nr:uncharacterized protein LOC125016591 isoform X2 [Mugil cephalus]
MQSPTQAHSGSNTDPPPHAERGLPAQGDPDLGRQRSKAAATSATVVTPEESESSVLTAETPSSMAVRSPVENKTADITAKTTAGPNKKSEIGGLKTNKQEKGVTDGRKYVPSKKAMIDPLKIDMSSPKDIPSSHLSLQCSECHIIFRDDKSKERHLKLNHPVEYEQCILRNSLFACYVCDRQFTNSSELLVHQKGHTEKKPFKCPLCDQAFRKSSELTGHKKVHFGQDGYACTECGKACKSLTLLRYHQRTHTGERPYVCKECGKRFTMSKALQKHVISHSTEEAKGDGGGATAKTPRRKSDGASTIKYPCSECKNTFKSLKNRTNHLKLKHNILLAPPSYAHKDKQQVEQRTPIITPISICQSALLQVEPNGPLQKVDANIDTEQIRRLIESMGNVQKVNQVVILGQVPPDAPPLEVQQISQLAGAANLSLDPPQIDFIGPKQTDSKIAEFGVSNNPCDSMEQTIILEPITPEGQLENPPFSELGSHITAGESIELTPQAEHTERPEVELRHQELQQSSINVMPSDPMNGMVCPSEVDHLKENLEQTVILELTPALIPTMELEQSQTVPQNEIPSSSVLNNEVETPDQTLIDEQQTNVPVPPLMSTVELELTSLQPEQPFSSCSFVSPNTFTQTPSELQCNPKEEVDPQVQTVGLDQVHPVMDGDALQESQEKTEREAAKKLLVESKNNPSEVEALSSSEEAPSQLHTERVPQISELPVNLMSAQELVKVRKRKPARTFIFQEYMQDLIGSTYKDDLEIDAKPTKRQRTKKSHLVVKFGPQVKEKTNKKQKKPSQQHLPIEYTKRGEMPTTDPSENKGPSLKKGRHGKKDKTVGNLLSTAESKSTRSPQQIKEDKRKSPMKKQKDVAKGNVAHISERSTVASSKFKKKKQAKIMRKGQPKNGKTKKNVAQQEKVKKADVPGPCITQDSLLLLKGHKQPQLKVYKLDPSKAPGQALETSPQSNESKFKHLASQSTDNLTAKSKKKGGRPKNQKALSLLSSIQVPPEPPENQPVQPKATRKRKASPKVETEGVITSSHSKRALECKDCGERFNEVSSLQKHKTTVHIVESPCLTYTNGNIFEGVSRMDLFRLPKGCEKVVGVMAAATDWDTEPELVEMALEDRERSVSFPALVPSPSLPVPPPGVDVNAYEVKGASKTAADNRSQTSSEVQPLSNKVKSGGTPSFASESTLGVSTQTKTPETGEPLSSDEDKREEATLKNSDSEIQGDEDIKEDLLLEVDLVTVGEQNERDDPPSHEDPVPQSKSNGGAGAQVINETSEKRITSQTVSCSTQQVEVKEEDEEISLQKKKEGGKGTVTRNATRGRRRGMGRLKRYAASRRVSVVDIFRETESEKEEDECQVVYEKGAVTSDSEMTDHGCSTKTPEPNLKFKADKSTAPVAALPSIPSTLEESPEEQVVLEQESVTSSANKAMSEREPLGGEEQDRETDQSPTIILEKVLTSRQMSAGDKESCLMTVRNNPRQASNRIPENEVQVLGSQEIKVEESGLDQPLVPTSCQNRQNSGVQPQHHREIRTVLVKEETSLLQSDALASQGSKHIRWNVEPVDHENTANPLVQSEDATNECRVSPEFNTNQCIFYPVKEEEREVLLGAAQDREMLTPEECGAAHQTEHPTADVDIHVGRHSSPNYQEPRVRSLMSQPGVSDFAEGQDFECRHPAALRHFLLQNSDEEDNGSDELSDPQLDSEAEIMAYFYKDSAQQPDPASQTSPASTSHLQALGDENRTREPIDYFTKYFGWDTWVEIASYSNKVSNKPNPVTSREVACFVGIHIAMGTLRFPCPKLYWEDLTKVPLIAGAMPQSRFLELSRMLKLTSQSKDPGSSNVQEGTCDSPSRHSVISQQSDSQYHGDKTDDSNGSQTQTDPLWKVQSLLSRFRAGCQSLKQEGDYAVDQYPLPLTGKMHRSKQSLNCTALIGFGGSLLHVDLKLDLSDKEDAVEKMVPKGSMVFLCKQELSTPAMLERLLVAGVHGAGRVVGARGQIGDEFVSSDGKLMLRRSQCGFILSTAGHGHRNMASLTDNFEKAQMSARLNRDLRNLYSIPLTASAPTCWPQAVLWYLTDLALVNCWLQYRQDHRGVSAPLTLMAFRLEVSKALILSSGSDTQDSVPPHPPAENPHATNETPNPVLVEESPLPDAAVRYDGLGHWPEQLEQGEGGRCRFGDCQRTSRVLCLKCCVFLCISRNHNCFLNFHNQRHSEEE